MKNHRSIVYSLATALILNLAACSSGLGTSKDSTKDPSENVSPPETTRIICFQLNETRNEIIGYFGIDDNGDPCPKDVAIPKGISSIRNSAFKNNALTSVFFPQSLMIIGDNAFEGNSLTLLVIPNGVTSIGNSAFKNNALTSVTIPNSVTSIGDSAFAENLGLGVVYVPNSSPVVANNAFPNDYVFGEGTRFSCFVMNNTGEVTITNYLNSDSEGNCPKSVIIPQRVISIGASAFKDNSLTLLTIPNSVTTIGANAFTGNSFSSYVYIPNANATVDATAFDSNVIVVIEGS